MCGRYALFETEKLQDRFKVKVTSPIKPNFNVAPTQHMPIIRLENGARKLEIFDWGIHRVVGEDKIAMPINTRSDKALGRFWKKQVTTQRCIIPANAFYEWPKNTKGLPPFVISLPDKELYAFAGIWNTWKDKDGNVIDEYSIITTDPNKEMQSVHDRMPVILHKEDEERWLNDELTQEEIEELMLPSEDGRLTMYVGSPDINSVKNNNENLLEPAKQ